MFGHSFVKQLRKSIEQVADTELIKDVQKSIKQAAESELVKNAVSKAQSGFDVVSQNFNEQPDDEPIKKEARSIIRKASTSAAVTSGAMAQGSILALDTPVLISIHVGMVAALGALFGKKVNHANAMAILGAAAGVGIGVAGVKAVSGVIPIVGNLTNAAVSFSYTESLGWFCFNYFKDTLAKNEAMSNFYISGGQIGAVGDNSQSHNNTFNQYSQPKQTLDEAALEIQRLLKQLEDANPKATETQKEEYINISVLPDFKDRVVAALKNGGETAIDELVLENKYLKIVKSIIKGWASPNS